MTDSAPKREAKCGCCGSVNLEMRKYPVHGCETDCGELADDGTPCRETRPWCSYCGSIGVATPAERPVEEKRPPAPAEEVVLHRFEGEPGWEECFAGDKPCGYLQQFKGEHATFRRLP